MPELTRQQNITLGEMCAAGVRGLLIMCTGRAQRPFLYGQYFRRRLKFPELASEIATCARAVVFSRVSYHRLAME
jgi:hypothetical protein